jgi:hypothetical protein
MRRLLDLLAFPILILLAILLLLAPFHPMPHVAEKIIMLKNGRLQRPMDILDLLFHLAPLLLLALTWRLSRSRP